MTTPGPYAIRTAFLMIGASIVLSSCAGAGSTSGSSSSPDSSPVSGTTTGAPGNSGTATNGTATATATDVRVPDVISLSLQEAIQNIEQVGLAVGSQKQEPNFNIPLMSVISTDPAFGTLEPTGFAVNLVVSAGPPQCPTCVPILNQMPDVIGQTLSQAEATLAAHNLNLAGYSFQGSPAPQGSVIQSTPAAGSSITLVGTNVTLVISSGPLRTLPVRPSLPVISASPSP